MNHHLTQPTEQEAGNTCNGHHHKTVLTEMHAMLVDVPRDRPGSLQPRLIETFRRRLDGFDENVIQRFAHSMTLRPMQRVLRELYGIDVSPTLIATITDEVHEACDTWRQRPLERCYAIVYLDAIHVKLRESGSVDTHAVYPAIGIDQQGHKAVLGMWLGEKEGAKFWLSVLNDLKARGVEDILVAVVDSLRGFPEALGTGHGLSCHYGADLHRAPDSIRVVLCAVPGTQRVGDSTQEDLSGADRRCGGGGTGRLRSARTRSALPRCRTQFRCRVTAREMGSRDSLLGLFRADPQGALYHQRDRKSE